MTKEKMEEKMEEKIVETFVVPNISLFIPRVFANITEQRIVKVFDDNSIGKVSRVDFVSKLDTEYKPYHSVYIHFETWYSNQTALNFYNRVVDPNIQARIVYNDPWYWIVLKNNGKKNELVGKRAVCLDTGSSSISSSVANYDLDKADGKLDLVSSDYVLILENTIAKNNDEIGKLRKDLQKKYDMIGFGSGSGSGSINIIAILNSQIEQLTERLYTTQYYYMELCEKFDVDVEEIVSDYILEENIPLTLDDLDTRTRIRALEDGEEGGEVGWK